MYMVKSSRSSRLRMRRTYTKLLDRTHRLDGDLSLLHRAVAVGVEPSTWMLNHILELCFEAGDGERARRVAADMARRSLRPNHRTLATLLARKSLMGSMRYLVWYAGQRQIRLLALRCYSSTRMQTSLQLCVRRRLNMRASIVLEVEEETSVHKSMQSMSLGASMSSTGSLMRLA